MSGKTPTMKFPPTIALLPFVFSSAVAFPHMLRDMGADNLQDFERMVRRSGGAPLPRSGAAVEKRQTQLPVSIQLPALPIPGLPIPLTIELPGISTVGTKIIPDAAHPFQAPAATDQRGGCPGLNIMSNYGYMSRTGVVGAGELIYAMEEMLGYSEDLALVLIALAIRSGAMDVTTLKMSIGGTDSRTSGLLSGILGPAAGLFTSSVHNRYEIDGSMAYDDNYFFAGGGHFNGSRFAAMQAIADANGGLYDAQFQTDHRYANYQQCIATNPTCTWNIVGEILFYGADCYTYLGMSSTDPTTNQISPPDSASIQSFFGAQKSGNTYIHVPEKLLPGPSGHWYRRSTPLTTAEIAGDAVVSYLGHPVPFGANDGTHVNSFSPSDEQFSGTGAGAFCIVLNTIQENDGVLSTRFGPFAANILAIVSSLVGPAFDSLGCSTTTK